MCEESVMYIMMKGEDDRLNNKIKIVMIDLMFEL